MATEYYYADPDKADDSGDGKTWGTAKKHISAAIAQIRTDLAAPFQDIIYLKLKGTVASPKTYGETANEIAIDGFLCGSGALFIQPEGWSDANYLSGGDPFAEGGSFEPSGAKPCTVPVLKVNRSTNVIVRGVNVQYATASAPDFGIDVQDARGVSFMYCKGSGFAVAAASFGFYSAAVIENCYFADSAWGVYAWTHSSVGVRGRTALKNNTRGGLLAQDRCGLFVYTHNGSDDYATLEVRTTSRRDQYAAVKLEFESALGLQTPGPVPIQDIHGYLKIINEDSFKSAEYYGVVLETRSSLLGAGNVFFADPSVNEGKDTVPGGNQVVQANGEGTLTID